MNTVEMNKHEHDGITNFYNIRNKIIEIEKECHCGVSKQFSIPYDKRLGNFINE